MKHVITMIATLALAGLLVSCGKPDSSTSTSPDPATQPEAQAVLFQRTVDRAKSLIESKDFKGAQAAVDVFKQYKLTPEQQKTVDQLQSQIPK